MAGTVAPNATKSSSRQASPRGPLRVSSKSDCHKVAGAVAYAIREKGRVEIQTIGAGALNQAIKAIAIARGFFVPSGVDLYCRPAFSDLVIDGQERTAIKLFVDPLKP